MNQQYRFALRFQADFPDVQLLSARKQNVSVCSIYRCGDFIFF